MLCLHIGNNYHLHGSLPEELFGVLANLVSINLASAGLSGSLPEGLGSLEYLQHLDLHMNEHMTGSIPDSLFGNFSSALTHLLLGNTGLSGELPTTIGYAQSLRQLGLNSNDLSGPLPEELFERLPALADLDLADERRGLAGALPTAIQNTRSLCRLSLAGNRIYGALPDGIGALLALQDAQLHRNKFSGILPLAIAEARALRMLNIGTNYNIHGALPDGIGQVIALVAVECKANALSGKLPDSIQSLSVLKILDLTNNDLSGSLPYGSYGLQSLQRLLLGVQLLNLGVNKITGSIPEGMVGLRALKRADLGFNRLSGGLPDAVWALQSLEQLNLDMNALTGALPEGLGYMSCLKELLLQRNHLCGVVPGATKSMQTLEVFRIKENELSGRLPADTWRLSRCRVVSFAHNKLAGPIPEAICSMRSLTELRAHNNQLTGCLPHALSLSSYYIVTLSHNHLSGPMPAIHCSHLYIRDNLFAGSIPVEVFGFHQLSVFDASANFFEGECPRFTSGNGDMLRYLEIAGAADAVKGGLRGPVPDSLMRARYLTTFLAHNNRLSGKVDFPGTLKVLSLHNNAMKHILQLPRCKSTSGSGFFLHHNDLSCRLGGDEEGVNPNQSLCALGNQLQRPGKSLPAWVSEFEQADSLFWAREGEGLLYWLRFSGGVALFGAAVRQTLGCSGSWQAIINWHAALGGGQGVLKTAMFLLDGLSRRVLESTLLVVLLLHWTFYSCPSTVALASACRRQSPWTKCFVVVLWARHYGQLPPGRWEEVLMSANISRKSLAIWSLWILLTVPLGSLTFISMASRSVPNFLDLSGRCLKGIDAGVGAFQGILTAVILPALANRLAQDRHAYTSVANLLHTFCFPGLWIIYFEHKCLGYWTAFWTPCKKQIFNFQGVGPDGHSTLRMLDGRDVCSPSSRTSPASCCNCMLLSLQDVLFGKLISSALLVPSWNLLFSKFPKDAKVVLLRLELLLQLTMLVSGPLPLLTPVLCVAVLTTLLMAAVAREKAVLKFTDVDQMPAASVCAGLLFSAIVHIGFTSEELLPFGLLLGVILMVPQLNGSCALEI